MVRVSLCLLMALASLAGAKVRADSVHLAGGAVIEGKATREGDKVVVELSGGRIALDAASVERIERSESDVERFERRYAALDKDDVVERLALANFCRDRGMRGREERLLREVIERAPDHAEARARLGFVRHEGSWLSRDEHARAQGLVEFEGRFITPQQLLQLERLRAETAKAAHAREQAALELEAKRRELQSETPDAPAGAEAAVGHSTTIIVGGSPYPYPYPYPYPHIPPPPPPPHRHYHPPPGAVGRCAAPPCPDQRPRMPRLIPHVRDPSEYF